MNSLAAPDLRTLVGSQVLQKGMKLVGQSGLNYLLTDNLADFERNVWIAKDACSKSPSWFIVKQPKWPYANKAVSWAARLRRFEQEVKMNKIFKGAKFIRQQVDTIKPTSQDDPPRVVLEAMWDSVWRVGRASMFTRQEVKAIMKMTLQALQEVEQKDFMHADLNMDDMFINAKTLDRCDPAQFIAKIANPVSLVRPNRVYEPKKLIAHPNNAPEILFGKPAGFPAHIWTWGIIFCHLLESRSAWMCDRADSMDGDRLLEGRLDYQSLFEGRDMVRDKLTAGFNLKQCEYYADCDLPKQSPHEYPGWKEHLIKKGLSDDDICFLDWVLDPNPETRPTSEQIMQSGFLEWSEKEREEDP
ncbi:hypothetical protein IWX49DRAFT_552255 [Phyllosticta citricarpa]|uniref:cyclin-dependent kinase n=2 Tax=Phyllosticta TaxID=121621 RepID=A0ABR1MG48_9PEZI